MGFLVGADNVDIKGELYGSNETTTGSALIEIFGLFSGPVGVVWLMTVYTPDDVGANFAPETPGFTLRSVHTSPGCGSLAFLYRNGTIDSTFTVTGNTPNMIVTVTGFRNILDPDAGLDPIADLKITPYTDTVAWDTPRDLAIEPDGHLYVGHFNKSGQTTTGSRVGDTPTQGTLFVGGASGVYGYRTERLESGAAGARYFDGNAPTTYQWRYTHSAAATGFAWSVATRSGNKQATYTATPRRKSAIDRSGADSASSVTVPRPARVVEGDCMVAFIGNESGTTTPVGLPAGWTIVHQENATGVSGAVAYKVATASEPSDYTFTTNDPNAMILVVDRYHSLPPKVVVALRAAGTTGSTAAQITLPVNRYSRVFFYHIAGFGPSTHYMPAGTQTVRRSFSLGSSHLTEVVPSTTGDFSGSFGDNSSEGSIMLAANFEVPTDAELIASDNPVIVLKATSSLEAPRQARGQATFQAKSSLLADYNVASLGKQRAYPIAAGFSYAGIWNQGPRVPSAAILDEDISGGSSDGQNTQTTSPPAGTYVDSFLSPISTPATRTNHVVRVMHGKSASGGKAINVTVELKQGATVIASFTVADSAIASFTNNFTQLTLTQAQASAITDYSNLAIRVTPLAAGGGAGRDYLLDAFDFSVDPPANLWTGTARFNGDSTLGIGASLNQFSAVSLNASSSLLAMEASIPRLDGAATLAADSNISFGNPYAGPAPVVSGAVELRGSASLFAHGVKEIQNPPARVPPVIELPVWNDITSSSTSVVPLNTTINQHDLLVLPFVLDVTSGSAAMANPTVTGTAVLGPWLSRSTANGNGDPGIRTVTFYARALTAGTLGDATFTHPIAVEKASKPLIIEGPAYVHATAGQFGPGAGPVSVALGSTLGDYDTILGIVGNRSGSEPVRAEAPTMTSFALDANSDTTTVANGTNLGIGVAYWDGPNLPSSPTTFSADFLGVTGNDAVAVQLVAIIYRSPIQAYVHLGAGSTLSASATTESTGPETQEGVASCVASSSMVVSGSVVGTLAGDALFAGAASMSAAVVVEVAGTTSLAADSSLTSGGALDVTSTATLSATSSLGSTAALTATSAVSLDAASTLVATDSVQTNATATLSGTSTLSLDAAAVLSADVALAADSTLAAPSVASTSADATWSGEATLAVAADVLASGDAALSATSSLALTDTVTVPTAVSFQGDADLSADSLVATSSDVTLTAGSALAAPSLVGAVGDVALSAQTSLSTTAVIEVLADASLAATSSLSSSNSVIISTAVEMSADSTVSTSGAVDVLAESNLAADSTLISTALSTAQAEASLSGSSLMGTSGERGVLAEASLSAESSLAAASDVTTEATATLAAASTLSTSGDSLAIVEGAAALAANASLSTMAESQVLAGTTLAATSTLSADGTRVQFASDTMAATGTLATTADVLVAAEAALVSTATFGSTGTATVTTEAALDATSSMSVGAGVLSDTNAMLSATSSLSTASTVTVTSSAALAATATFGSTGSATAIGTASLAADSTLTGEGTRQTLGAVALTAEASLTSSATSLSSTSATLVASSSLVLGHLVTVEAEATLAGTSSFTTSADRTAVAEASLSGISTLSGSGARLISGEVVLAESSSLTTVGSVQVLATTTLSADSTLSTTGLNVVQATVTLSAVGEFLSPVILEISAQVALAAGSSLGAGGRSTSNTSSDMDAVSSLTSTADVLHLGQTVLTGTTSLLSSGFALTSAVGAMVASTFLQAEGERATTGGVALESGSTLVVLDRVISGGPGVISLSITARKAADVSLKTVEVV